jgi:hypothetical protein
MIPRRGTKEKSLYTDVHFNERLLTLQASVNYKYTQNFERHFLGEQFQAKKTQGVGTARSLNSCHGTGIGQLQPCCEMYRKLLKMKINIDYI